MIEVRQPSAARAAGIRIALVLSGSLLMALSAKLTVPMYPVPITGQTLAIPLVVALLGRTGAVLAMLAYLAEGALGLPVFAPGALMSTTGGYLLAFPLAAFAIGWLFDHGFDRTYAARLAAIVAGTSVVFAGGLSWLVGVYHVAPGMALAVGVVPFLIGDALKCALAAALTPCWPRIAARLGLSR